MKILSSFVIFLLLAVSSCLWLAVVPTNINAQFAPTDTPQAQMTRLKSLQSSLAVPQWPPDVTSPIQGLCPDPYFIVHQPTQLDMELRFSKVPLADQIKYFVGNFSDSFGQIDQQCLVSWWEQNKFSFNPQHCFGDHSASGSGHGSNSFSNSGSNHGSFSHGGSNSNSDSWGSFSHGGSNSNPHGSDSWNTDLPSDGAPSESGSPPNGGDGTTQGNEALSSLISSVIESVIESSIEASGGDTQPPSPSDGGGGDESLLARDAQAQGFPECLPFGEDAGCLMFNSELFKLSLMKVYKQQSPGCWCPTLNRDNTACAGAQPTPVPPVTTQPTPAPPVTTQPPRTTVTNPPTVTSRQQTSSTQAPSQQTSTQNPIVTTRSTTQQPVVTTSSATTNAIISSTLPPIITTGTTLPPIITSATVLPPPVTTRAPTTRPPTTATPRPSQKITTTSTTLTTARPSSSGQASQTTSPASSEPAGSTTTAKPTETTPAPTLPPTSVEAVLANPSNFNMGTAKSQIASKLSIDESTIKITKLNETSIEIDFSGPNAAQNVKDFMKLNTTELGAMDLSSAKAAPGAEVTPSPTPETSDGRSNAGLIGAVAGVLVVVIGGGYLAYRKWSTSGGTGSSGSASNGKGGITQAFNFDYDEDLMLNNTNEFSSSDGGSVSTHEMMRL